MQKMINFADVIKEQTKEHNANWPESPDHPYRILIIEGSGSAKTNSLFNVLNRQSDIDEVYLHTKDAYNAKYQFLINKQKSIEFSMILKFLLNTQMIWMIMKNVTQKKS